MSVVSDSRSLLGVAPICDAIGLPRATYYRSLKPKTGSSQPRRSGRELSEEEREAVVDVLHEERFVDLAPAEIHHILLKEGRFLCSVRTIYRILKGKGEIENAAIWHEAGPISGPNSSPKVPTSFGVGTSPASLGQKNGVISNSM